MRLFLAYNLHIMPMQSTYLNSMRYLWRLSFFCSISIALTTTDIRKHPNWMLLKHTGCGYSDSDRIIGGKNANLGAYPWIARIGYSYPDTPGEISYRCGGTLINRLYVVTAAHCVTNLPGSFKVSGIRLGEHNTLTDPDCEHEYCAEPVQDFQPASIVVHKDYNHSLYKNDIAIIRLSKTAIYNEHVRPICMVTGQLLTNNFVGETAEVAGWGIYDIYKPQPSTILQTVKLPIIETDKCKRAYKTYADIGDQQICVGGAVGKDSCRGDSGGPLMKLVIQNGPPRYYFIGVVSFGMKHCGGSRMPAVYSKIAKYATWILDHVSP